MAIILRTGRIGQSVVVGPTNDAPRVPAFARIVVKLRTPQLLRNVVNAGNTLHFAAMFLDDEHQPIAPTSVTWQLFGVERRDPISAGAVNRLYPEVDIRIAPVPSLPYYNRDEHRTLVVTASRGAEMLSSETSFRVLRMH